MEGELLLKKGMGGVSEKTFAVLMDCSDFIIYSAPTKEEEIVRFKSTICWISSANNNVVGNKGLFVVNDSHNCCMFFFEAGSPEWLDQWLSAFAATGWKISTVVGSGTNNSEKKEPQFTLYNNQAHSSLHQEQQQSQLERQEDNNWSREPKSQSFDPSQLKYASLSLNSSVNFNSLQMMGDSDTNHRSTRSLVDSKSSHKHYQIQQEHQHIQTVSGLEEKVLPEPQMERSVSLPSLLQNDTVLLSQHHKLPQHQKHEVEQEEEDEEATIIDINQPDIVTNKQSLVEDQEQVVVKLRNPKLGESSTSSKMTGNVSPGGVSNAGGARLRPRSNIYRRSNAAESGYCSKESLLMVNDVERFSPLGEGSSPPSPVGGDSNLTNPLTTDTLSITSTSTLVSSTNNATDVDAPKQFIVEVPYSLKKDPLESVSWLFQKTVFQTLNPRTLFFPKIHQSFNGY